MAMAAPLVALIGVLALLAVPRPLFAQPTLPKLVIAGAPSLAPLAEQYTAVFRKDHPGIEVEIRGGGSNYAVEAALRGAIDVGLVTRSLTGAEKADLFAQVVGRDAIVLLSYPGNRAPNLTVAQIRRIYSGEITNWWDVGGEEKGIIALTREKGSALRTIFLERVFGKGFNGQEKAFIITS